MNSNGGEMSLDNLQGETKLDRNEWFDENAASMGANLELLRGGFQTEFDLLITMLMDKDQRKWVDKDKFIEFNNSFVKLCGKSSDLISDSLSKSIGNM